MKQGKHTVIKEMAFILKERNGDYIFDHSFKDKYTNLVFLVRHPAFSVRSYMKIASQLNDPLYYLTNDFGYEDMWKLYEKH